MDAKKYMNYAGYVLIAISLLYYIVITQTTLKSQENEISTLKLPSQIEITNQELTQSILDSAKYEKLEAENKRLKENAIWKQRCLEKKILWEKLNCNEDLERFANYSK